jgi:hypothetical protein
LKPIAKTNIKIHVSREKKRTLILDFLYVLRIEKDRFETGFMTAARLKL